MDLEGRGTGAGRRDDRIEGPGPLDETRGNVPGEPLLTRGQERLPTAGETVEDLEKSNESMQRRASRRPSALQIEGTGRRRSRRESNWGLTKPEERSAVDRSVVDGQTYHAHSHPRTHMHSWTRKAS